MQFNEKQKKQLRKQGSCIFMDLEDAPLDCESWQCLHKPQVWSVLETKRVYEKKVHPGFLEYSNVMIAMDSGWGLYAIFENDKLLSVERNNRFTVQLEVREREVLVMDKEYHNTTRCIWI